MICQTHACVKRYETSDKYFSYKMEENSSTSAHVLRMSGVLQSLVSSGSSLVTITKLLELRDEL